LQAIDGIDIWHQQQIFVDAAENSTSSVEVVPPERKLRHLLDQEQKEQIIEFKKNHKQQAVPQTTAMQITLVIRISFSYIPENLLAKTVALVIEENEQELIMMLQELSAFYTYFKPLDGITSDVVVELTPPPTSGPTTYALFLASQEEQVVTLDENGFGFGAVSQVIHFIQKSISLYSFCCVNFTLKMVGIAVGFLWCCLTGCSVFYLMKARNSMKEQHDLEDLLKQEKSSPLADAESSSDTYVPMGNDDSKSTVIGGDDHMLEKKKADLDGSQRGTMSKSIRQCSKINPSAQSPKSSSHRNSSSRSSRKPTNSHDARRKKATNKRTDDTARTGFSKPMMSAKSSMKSSVTKSSSDPKR
jgi:hypothetical protein